jgi:hypothetical protein
MRLSKKPFTSSGAEALEEFDEVPLEELATVECLLDVPDFTGLA